MSKARDSNVRAGHSLAPESVWSAADPEAFLECAEAIIRCRDQRDYDALPRIGKMVVAVYRLERTVEAEGLYQFVEYDRDLVEETVQYLGEMGATNKAGILARLAVLDAGQEDRFDALAAQWQHAGEDSAALLQAYGRSHRQEFDEMLRSRAMLSAPAGTGRPSDDELRRQAYSDGPAPLDGYEQFLLEPARMGLLIQLAADPRCPSRAKAVAALYAIAGSIGTDVLAGKPAFVQELTDAIAKAKSLDDAELGMWAEAVRAMLDAPDPETLMRWMAALFASDGGLGGAT